MNLSVIYQKEGQTKTYYYLKDQNKNMFFGKKLTFPKDEQKILHEIDMLNLFSEFNIGPKFIYYDSLKKMMICEYIAGQSLKNKILDINETVKTILEICNILEVIHNKGYIFGDLKPSNIIVGERTVLIDFECVTRLGSKLDYASQIYCSPYQKKDKTAVYQFDFYSLGMIFLELLIGYEKLKYYYDSNLIQDIDPKKIVINLPDEINNVIRKLLSKKVENNYRNIFELKKDLLAINFN